MPHLGARDLSASLSRTGRTSACWPIGATFACCFRIPHPPRAVARALRLATPATFRIPGRTLVRVPAAGGAPAAGTRTRVRPGIRNVAGVARRSARATARGGWGIRKQQANVAPIGQQADVRPVRERLAERSLAPRCGMSGKVYLVGAGPGDPELLTIRAARVLASADVVLYDALVSREVLALISRSAQLVDVGKRAGKKLLTQDELNKSEEHT